MKNKKTIGKTLRALANERRLIVITLLKTKGERSVSQISRHLHLSFRSTSKHLTVLKSAGLVEYRQEGLTVFYRISSELGPIERSIINLL